ncbi:uncharacterized protein LOC143886180 [Tasmannia lanceolata]|uniref:uncharacterized protein LOC143886180 n=1 Tax=Tasmannia lanceolata TaxID=3420 RepID=UPI0040631D19
MVVATKMSALPHYPKSIMLPCSKLLRSRFLLVGCLQKTACTFSSRLYPSVCFYHAVLPSLYRSRRVGWSVRSSVDGGRSDPSESSSSTNGGTRLVRAIQAFRIKLNARIKEIKKGFPMKLQGHRLLCCMDSLPPIPNLCRHVSTREMGHTWILRSRVPHKSCFFGRIRHIVVSCKM